MRLSRHAFIGLAMSAAMAAPRQAAAAPMTLSGTVFYRERIALAPTAVVEVKLIDVSRADAPAETIAETRISDGRQVPVPFTLSFDSSRIEPRRSYALQARILDGERLLFINAMRHAVFAGGKDEGVILVERAAAPPGAAAPASPVGRWLAEDIKGGGVIDRLQTVLEIAADGTVTGTGGCNRIRGKAAISGAGIVFGNLASTQMACTPAAMDQEARFLGALGETQSFRVDLQQHKLILLGAGGQSVMRLAAL